MENAKPPDAVANGDGGANDGNDAQGQQGGFGTWGRFLFQMVMVSMVMNMVTQPKKSKQPGTMPGTPPDTQQLEKGPNSLRNLYGQREECDLYVHLSEKSIRPSFDDIWNESHGAEKGLQLLWHTRVSYAADAASESLNVTVGPLASETLLGDKIPFIIATLVRTNILREKASSEEIVSSSLPLVARLRELDPDAGNEGLLFTGENDAAAPKKNKSSTKLPYFKTKLEIRPVVDQTVHSPGSLSTGHFKKFRALPQLGAYQPYLYVSDFWLLEKDYVLLNETLAGQPLNLSLSYSVITMWAWSMQAQMAEQWTTQGEWGLTDTQRDSFMLKRLYTDTNPYLLAFSGAFLLMHTVFSMLAFKNDIQFWRKNESMEGLSARSMCVSFVCQLITALFLLDSQETSRLLLFNITLDTALSFWKLKKAVKIEFHSSFPFINIGGQKGYEASDTSKHDGEAISYMCSMLTPLFVGYALRSLVHDKHRSWYSFMVSTAAGGVYTFGFAMMTPQLYINYKLKSVEHLPWRALTYKAMNTFVDDIAALLIDMPFIHRLSCFRDDVIFFIYLYQRWAYRVDRTRPTMWNSDQPAGTEIAAGSSDGGQEGAAG